VLMLAKRIIPCLDMDNGRVVKGVAFENIRDAGDPIALAGRYYREGADELVFLDIGASCNSRDILIDVVERVSDEVFIPLTVGGGLRTVADMRRVLLAGADKVSVCTAALLDPKLVARGAAAFGAQCIVVSVDARRDGDRWIAWSHGGRQATGWEALDWMSHCEELGAGEILLNSIDRDGTQSGYDLELLRRAAGRLSIPLIASGGGGTLPHTEAALNQGQADAVLLASVLHDGKYAIPEIKEYLRTKGVIVR